MCPHAPMPKTVLAFWRTDTPTHSHTLTATAHTRAQRLPSPASGRHSTIFLCPPRVSALRLSTPDLMGCSTRAYLPSAPKRLSESPRFVGEPALTPSPKRMSICLATVCPSRVSDHLSVSFCSPSPDRVIEHLSWCLTTPCRPTVFKYLPVCPGSLHPHTLCRQTYGCLVPETVPRYMCMHLTATLPARHP